MSFSIRQFIFFAVLLAVPVTAYFMVFEPQGKEIVKARQQIAHKTAMLEKLREATRQTEDLQRANEEIRQSIEAIESRLPTRKEMDSVLRQVANLAEQNELRVPEFKKSDKPAPAGLALEQPLEIKMEGDFDGFYQFLLELEQLPRITRMTDLSLKRSTDDEEGNMEAEFVLSVYYQGGSDS